MRIEKVSKYICAVALVALALLAQVTAQGADAAGTQEPLWKGMAHLDEWAANVRTNQSLRTWDKFRREQYEPFLRREIVQPYLDFSADKGTERFAAGSNLLERFVTDITWFRSTDYGVQTAALGKSMRRTAEEAAKLVTEGSDWPLFQIIDRFCGLGEKEWPNLHEMAKLLSEIPDIATYSFVRALGAGVLWSPPSGLERSGRPPIEAWGLCAECIIHWLNHRQFAPDEARPVLLALELTAKFPGSNSSGGNFIVVPQILDHCPNIDPWIRELVLGCLTWRIETAGATEANTKALEHWFKAWTLRPEYPEAPYQILHGAMNDPAALMRSGLPGTTTWFNRVQEAEVDYAPAYSQYAYPLSPIWYGDTKLELAFAEAIRKADRPDLLFSFLYGHIVALAIGNTEIKTWDLFRDDAFFVPYRDFMAKVAETPSSLRDPPLVAAHLLALAEFSRGDIDAAMRWAEKLAPDDFATGTGYSMGDFKYPSRWGSSTNSFDCWAVNSVLAALGGPNGGQLAPLVKLSRLGRWTEFLKALETERGKGLVLSEAEADFLGREEAKALLHVPQPDGAPLSPRFDRLFTGWEHANGWVFDDSDGIAGFAHTNKLNKHGRISWRGDLPRNVRISGHIQFPVTNACLVAYLGWHSAFEEEGPAVAFLRAEDGLYAQAGNAVVLSEWNSEAGSRWGVLHPLKGPADPSRKRPPSITLPDAPGISIPVQAGISRDAADFEIESRHGLVSVAIDGKRVVVNAPLAPLYALSGQRTKAPLRFRGNGVKISGIKIEVFKEGEQP